MLPPLQARRQARPPERPAFAPEALRRVRRSFSGGGSGAKGTPPLDVARGALSIVEGREQRRKGSGDNVPGLIRRFPSRRNEDDWHVPLAQHIIERGQVRIH